MVSEIVCIFVCGHLSLWKDVGWQTRLEIWTFIWTKSVNQYLVIWQSISWLLPGLGIRNQPKDWHQPGWNVGQSPRGKKPNERKGWRFRHRDGSRAFGEGKGGATFRRAIGRGLEQLSLILPIPGCYQKHVPQRCSDGQEELHKLRGYLGTMVRSLWLIFIQLFYFSS